MVLSWYCLGNGRSRQPATAAVKNRLRSPYGDKIEIITIGEPTTPNGAYVLAVQDKCQVQR